MPPIEQLQRVPQLLLERLERQGVFTTGLLLEVSETRTRRQTLADQIQVTTNDINSWRDEALLLNLAGFGAQEQAIFTQAGIIGLADLLALDQETFEARIVRAAHTLGVPAPEPLTMEGWFHQAQTLDEE
ncbi:MAG: DUF4332 domain-containing protein [Chloroflexota bacterium]